MEERREGWLREDYKELVIGSKLVAVTLDICFCISKVMGAMMGYGYCGTGDCFLN